MSDEQQPDIVGHIRIIGLTLWFGFILSMGLGASFVERILIGAGFILGILIPGYDVRWWVQHARSANRGEGVGTENVATENKATSSSARGLVAIAAMGVPAAIINLVCRLCNDYAEFPRGMDAAMVAGAAAETFALLWALGVVCWCLVFGYQALKRDWRAARVAAAACVLGTAASVINGVWLWR